MKLRKMSSIRLNKKVVESIALSACTVALACSAVFSGADEILMNTISSELNVNGKAGIVAMLEQSETSAFDMAQSADMQIAKTDVEVVAVALEENTSEAVEQSEVEATKAAQDTKEEVMSEPTMSKEEQEWQDKVMATVKDSLSIRAKADAEAEIVGKMYSNSVATVIKKGDVWTKIESGSVKGYVKNSYLVFGSDAYKNAYEVCKQYAVAKTDGLRVRSEATVEASVLTTVDKGDKLLYNSDEKRVHGWVAVKTDAGNGYVSAEYIKIKLDTADAMSMKEIEEQKAKEEAEAKVKAEAKAMAEKKVSNASADDITLLAAIIQCEAGSEPYVGQVAVGAVVLNRMRSSNYPNTISGVIYQRGQFGPASSGILARRLASGNIQSSCRQAALEALEGVDPTNGKKSFHRANGARGQIIGNHVFF